MGIAVSAIASAEQPHKYRSHDNLQCNYGCNPEWSMCQKSFRPGYSFNEERGISQIKYYNYTKQRRTSSIHPPAENPIDCLEHKGKSRFLIESQAVLSAVQKWRYDNITGMTDQVKYNVRTYSQHNGYSYINRFETEDKEYPCTSRQKSRRGK